MHRGKIKRLLSRSVAFPLAPSGTRFAIDYKLAAKFISRMPLRRPTKGESHELLSFSLLFLDCCDLHYRFGRTPPSPLPPETTSRKENSP